MYRIGKVFRFEGAHSLPHLPEGHKCRRPHGHSYTVEVVLNARYTDKDYFVVDYAALDGFKRWIDEHLDHRDLNQVLGIPSTAENIASYLYDVLRRSNWTGDVNIERVRVKETENTFAEFVPMEHS